MGKFQNLKGKTFGRLTVSCGCLNKERVSLTSKKYNKYDLYGEFTYDQ